MKYSRSAGGVVTFLAIAFAAAAGLGACGGPVECLRAVQCVHACGGAVVASGCIACPAGTFDNFTCAVDASNADATSDAASDSSPPIDAPVDVTTTDAPADAPADVTPTDASPFSCGTQTCGANQICVQPCSGIGTSPPPFCTDPPAGCGATPTCGCLSPGICPPASPPFAGCTQDSDRHFTCSGCA